MENKNNLLKFIGLLGIGVIIHELMKPSKSDSRFSISKNSNCTQELQEFNNKITISTERVENLKSAHTTIRRKVRDYFDNYTNIPKPDFFIQGSYKMKTLIEPLDLQCDVDLGVYFPEKPQVEFRTLQKHLKDALDSHTSRGVVIKQNCVRLNYVNDFHIDLPIYYLAKNGITSYFGSQGNNWLTSDPKKFILWFKLKINGKARLLRTIRYLKAWANNTKVKTGKKMPSGLVLTLWAVKYYKDSQRDDVAFCFTCLSIYKYLKNTSVSNWEAKMPVAPYDNVLERFSLSQRRAFLDELKEMVIIASEAITSTNSRTAQMKWRKIFGQQFEL